MLEGKRDLGTPACTGHFSKQYRRGSETETKFTVTFIMSQQDYVIFISQES